MHLALTLCNKLNSETNNALPHFNNFQFFLDSHGYYSVLTWDLSNTRKNEPKQNFVYLLFSLGLILSLVVFSTMYSTTAAAICTLQRFCHPAVLKHHALSSVCLRYRPASRAFISCTAELPLSEHPRELLAYADCVFVLPAALLWAQTALAELEHINHSCCHRCQLNYKDTQFLLRLIMRRLS